ncbi:lipoprotein [Klebsiella aerogenes]|nr:lipoprotein [Klebsiella aerogenes]
MKKPIVLPLIIALCTLLSGCIIDDGYHPHRHHHLITIMTMINPSGC